MIEKVNMAHPDKISDRIAGAIVDLAYSKEENPKIAVEVLIGHGKCHIIAETSVKFKKSEVKAIVKRIAGNVKVDFVQVPQDVHLAANQNGKIRCGDNGIFKGVPLTKEQKRLSEIARNIYSKYPYDGKYILDGKKLIICQSNAKTEDLQKMYPNAYFPRCKNGDPCHESAPRGSKTGTQGLKNSKERSRIPDALCDYIVELCQKGLQDKMIEEETDNK